MRLKDKINEDLRGAMRAKDEIRVSCLRLLNAALKNVEIEVKGELSDEKVTEVLSREAKKRREAVEAYLKGGREELAQKEEQEYKILQGYLPEQLNDDKIREVVREIIEEVGASGMSDFGKVMGAVMGRVKGRADGGVVQRMVKEVLIEIKK